MYELWTVNGQTTGREYEVHHDTIGFNTAQSRCRSGGGDVASIADAAENNHVASFARIGG